MFIQACTLVANSMKPTIQAFTNDVGQVPKMNANCVALEFNICLTLSLIFPFTPWSIFIKSG